MRSYLMGIIALLIMISSVFFINCSSEETVVPAGQLPVLTTKVVCDISQISVTSGGNITSKGASSVTARGVCWGTTANPTLNNNKSVDGTGIGIYSSDITGLSPNTTYHVRAYATNTAGTAYGNDLTFKTQPYSAPVTDIDGNVYKTVIIGTQVWMAENLKVTRFRNGDSIPIITKDNVWSTNTTVACCDWCYDNRNAKFCGKYYNFRVIQDSRNVCPVGWHVPTDDEWTTLANFLGGEDVAGSKLKESGTKHWNNTNNAVNTSGFFALGVGVCHLAGSFYFYQTFGYWWTSTPINANKAWNRSMTNIGAKIYREDEDFNSGLNIRCIKD
jgi:uncharacterized protein (TIGR02145 family)